MQDNAAIVIILFLLIAVISVLFLLLSLPIALVLSLSIFTIVIVFFKPFYGLLFYLILLFVRPQDFMPALEKFRIMLVLAAIVLTIFFIHKLIRKEKISIFTTRQHILMFLLLAIVPLSNIFNLRFADAWDGLNKFLQLFVLFFIIANIADNFEKFKKVCWTLFACTSIIAVNGIIQHFRGVDLGGISAKMGRIRWVGFFEDPNAYALLLVCFFPFIIVNLFEKGYNKFQKSLLVLIGIIFILAIFYTNSRGGFISLMIVLAFFYYRRYGFIKGIFIGLPILIAAIIFAPSRIDELSPYEASASLRIHAWITGLVMLKSHPIFGVGFSNFILFHERPAHSAFVTCFSELGLVGYFTWLALIYTSLIDLHKIEKLKNDSLLKKYGKILQISFIGFLAGALFISETYNPILYILIALTSLIASNPDITVRSSRFLSLNESLKVVIIIGTSIALFKLISMVYQ